MKKITFLLIFLGIFQQNYGSELPTQKQLIDAALDQLSLIRSELGKSPATTTSSSETAPRTIAQPSKQEIEEQKKRLQGAHFDRLSNTILAARNTMRMHRITQEAIANVTFATKTAHEIALQERFTQKNLILTESRLKRNEAEEELKALEEIKEIQDKKKQEAADKEKACRELQFLQEKKALMKKLSNLSRLLCEQDTHLSREIMDVRSTLDNLKHA